MAQTKEISTVVPSIKCIYNMFKHVQVDLLLQWVKSENVISVLCSTLVTSDHINRAKAVEIFKILEEISKKPLLAPEFTNCETWWALLHRVASENVHSFGKDGMSLVSSTFLC